MHIVYMLWVDKYRPSRSDDLKGHDSICAHIKHTNLNNIPNILLAGPPGSGKSSAVGVLSRTLYGDNWRKYVLAINASDSRSIKVVRETITSFLEVDTSVSASPGKKLMKLLILEEADALTLEAQLCLRTLIEKHSDRARFVLLVNYIHLLLPAIQSRCSTWSLSQLPDSDIMDHLLQIAQKENFNLCLSTAKEISSLVEGDMRKAVSVAQALKACRNGSNSDLEIIQILLRKPGRLIECQLRKIVEDYHKLSPHTLASELWTHFEQAAGGSCSIQFFLLRIAAVCSEKNFDYVHIESILDIARLSVQGCSPKLAINAVAACFSAFNRPCHNDTN